MPTWYLCYGWYRQLPWGTLLLRAAYQRVGQVGRPNRDGKGGVQQQICDSIAGRRLQPDGQGVLARGGHIEGS